MPPGYRSAPPATTGSALVRIVLAVFAVHGIFAWVPGNISLAQTSENGADSDADATRLVVVFPGGPAAGSTEQTIIDQFVATLAGELDRPLSGHYFNTVDDAIAFLERHPNSFVMGSTGFFLAQRSDLQLVPLAEVRLAGDRPERYYLVVKKGSAGTLADLKGKTLAGQPLYESSRFLDRIVFGGKLEVDSNVEVQATGRPLSALRKMMGGELDAVLLNPAQYDSLGSLPFAGDLETIFVSEPIPSVGFCMRDSEPNRQLRTAILEAVIRLPATEEGAAACKTFGIERFQPVDPQAIDRLIAVYDAPR